MSRIPDIYFISREVVSSLTTLIHRQALHDAYARKALLILLIPCSDWQGLLRPDKVRLLTIFLLVILSLSLEPNVLITTVANSWPPKASFLRRIVS